MPSRFPSPDTESAQSGPRPRLDTPGLLVDLSLVANASLDSAHGGNAFVNTLHEQAGLEAGVWIREGDQLHPYRGSGSFGSIPTVDSGHPLTKALQTDPVIVATLPDSRFEGIATEAHGSVAD